MVQVVHGPLFLQVDAVREPKQSERTAQLVGLEIERVLMALDAGEVDWLDE